MLYESPAFWKITGLSSRECLHKNLFERVHPEDQPAALQTLNEVHGKLGHSRFIAFRYRHKNGQWRWLEGTATNLLGESAVQSIVLNLRDVTERRRAEDDLARRLNELQLVYENGLKINGLLDVKEIARQAIEQIRNRLAWHHVSVRLLDPKSGTIRVIGFDQPASSDEEKAAHMARLNKMIIRPGEGLSGWVIQHGVPVRSGNVAANEHYRETFPNIRSGLYVPLKVGERTIGTISVESEQADAFTEEDERLLSTLAGQIAVAIENARLLTEAQ